MPEGVGLRFEPREKIMLQSHYVNTSDAAKAAYAEASATLHTDSASLKDAELEQQSATDKKA